MHSEIMWLQPCSFQPIKFESLFLKGVSFLDLNDKNLETLFATTNFLRNPIAILSTILIALVDTKSFNNNT